MRPRWFPGANTEYRGQGQVKNLICEITGEITKSVWALSPPERKAIQEGSDIEILMMGHPIPAFSVAINLDPKDVSDADDEKITS